MRKGFEFKLVAITSVLVSGCATNTVITAENLCQDWRHQTVGKEDQLTDKTASQIEANNRSRVTWGCKAGANVAKKG